MSEFLVIGHRGAMGHAPENTLLSVRKALEFGVHGVEIDVHFVDGNLLVIHDDALMRTTNGKGRLEEHSLEYLRSLDAGEGEKIPLLEEVIETVGGRIFINVELKGAGTARPVAAMLKEGIDERGWVPESFLVSSFNVGELRRFRDTEIGVRIGLLPSKRAGTEALTIARELGAYSINLDVAAASERVVAAARSQGFAVLVYTVNTASVARKLEAVAVNGVFSDYPELILNRYDTDDLP